MGHYQLGHIRKGIGLFSLLSFLMFFLAARLTALARRRFGPRWGVRDVADVVSMPLLSANRYFHCRPSQVAARPGLG